MFNQKALLAAFGVVVAVVALIQPAGAPAAEVTKVLVRPEKEPIGMSSRSAPQTVVRAGTVDELGRLTEALRAFDAAELSLPPYEVVFFDSVASCGGAKGLFDPSRRPWRISVCTNEMTWVITHELAHAWVSANVSRDQRLTFMESRGLERWAGPDVPWNQRGTEWAAVVIQQGLNGLPLPPALSKEAKARLESFELLTGKIAPVLVNWISDREVPCSMRPTELSRSIADKSGRSCLSAPGRTRVIDATGSQVQSESIARVVSWATDRFATAGLALPDATITFNRLRSRCGGNGGYYRRADRGNVIGICVGGDRKRELTVLHELAHAWGEEHLTPGERASFLSRRRLEHWNYPGDVWASRGTEQAAMIMTWGLDERCDVPDGLVDDTDGTLAVEFSRLTGTRSICVSR